MRIVIDLQACQSPSSRNRGIGRYSISLAQAIAQKAGNHEIFLLLNSQFPDTITPIRKAFHSLIPEERIHVFDIPTPVAELSSFNAWRIMASEQIREYAISCLNPDVVHVSSLFEGFENNVVTSISSTITKSSTGVTLYDLIPLMRADIYLKNVSVKNWYHRKLESLKKAELLLAISENSRQEAIDTLNIDSSKVINISSAIDDHFQPISLNVEKIRSLKKKYGIDRRFVMYTGGIDYRKNIEGLIQGYAKLPYELRVNYQLAIVCSIKPDEKDNLAKIAKKYGLQKQDLVLTGYVTDEDLAALYNLCDLFVFPSLYEGFGLPVLEAMACGAPVIGSNTSSIPEVVGRQDALFNPNITEDITQAIYAVLTNPELEKSLRTHGIQQSTKFSWSKSADLAIEAFEAMHERKISSKKVQVLIPSIKKKLAYLSPLPPDKSGIADYSLDLLYELTNFYEITLITDNPHISHPWLLKNCSVRNVTWFKNNFANFERVIYHFGNSDFHLNMFDLLKNHIGVVVLHDFYLSGALQSRDYKTMALGNLFGKSLYDSHGYSALLAYKAEPTGSVVLKYPCNKSVLIHSVGIISHSHYSTQLAHQWYGSNATRDWNIIPQLKPLVEASNSTQERKLLKYKDQDFLVCSFGMLSNTKLNHRLLEAWLSSSLAKKTNCYLIFVGENDAGQYGKDLQRKINESAIQNRICITGFVNSEIYCRHLTIADIAVQLRSLSRGETSRAILDVMSYGIPLIFNAHGTMSEYPDDLCIKLQDDFSKQELISALEDLYRDKSLREQINKAERNYINEYHDPKVIGQKYYDVIEKSYQNSLYAHYQDLLQSLGSIQTNINPNENDLIMSAEAIAANTPKLGQRQLLIDISELISPQQNINQEISKTSVYRVIVEILHYPLPNSDRVEPIYWDGKNYRYAQSFTKQILELNNFSQQDNIIDAYQGDIFLGLAPSLSLDTKSVLQRFKNFGIKTYVILYSYSQELQDKSSKSFDAWLKMISEIAIPSITEYQSVNQLINIILNISD